MLFAATLRIVVLILQDGSGGWLGETLFVNMTAQKGWKWEEQSHCSNRYRWVETMSYWPTWYA